MSLRERGKKIAPRRCELETRKAPAPSTFDGRRIRAGRPLSVPLSVARYFPARSCERARSPGRINARISDPGKRIRVIMQNLHLQKKSE